MKNNGIWALLEELAGKRGVTEVAINSPDKVFVEKEGRFFFIDSKLTKEDVFQFIQDVATFNKKSCGTDNPILDGVLPDGSRINVIFPPFVKKYPAITIRKYIRSINSFDKNPSIFGLNETWIYFLKILIKARCNIVVSGGTGVGKTTFLNLLLQEVPRSERVITIEDTRELSFSIPNLVQMETGGANLATKALLSAGDLVKNSLRMRPDRIIIGEIRGGELFDLLQAMNTGHAGSMTSIHANNTRDCLERMMTLYLLSGHDIPIKAIRGQMASAIDYLIQLTRNKEGERVISSISEITGMEGDSILTQQIADYVFTNEGGKIRFSGITPSGVYDLYRAGLPKKFFNEI